MTTIDLTNKVEAIREAISTEAKYKSVRQVLVDFRRPDHTFDLLDKINAGFNVKESKSLNDLYFYCTGKEYKTEVSPLEAIKLRPEVKTFTDKLDAKGIRWEINPVISKTTDEVIEDSFEFGINTYDFIWSWFKITLHKGDLYCDFGHSYSMNTGRTKKGLNRGCKVTKELHRQLGIADGSEYNLLSIKSK